MVLLIDAVYISGDQPTDSDTVRSRIIGVQVPTDVSKWFALGIAGMIGGVVFDLKWLYHLVAKGV